jgi:hypothetical protein
MMERSTGMRYVLTGEPSRAAWDKRPRSSWKSNTYEAHLYVEARTLCYRLIGQRRVSLQTMRRAVDRTIRRLEHMCEKHGWSNGISLEALNYPYTEHEYIISNGLGWDEC